MIDEVVILAAGQGTRMAAITHDRPKCMAPFQGGTILSRLLRQVAAHRPRRIVVVTGHRADVLEAYLAGPEFAGLPIEFVPNAAYRTTNSFASAEAALQRARGQLLMVNSDVVYDAEIIRRMVAADAPCAFAVDRSSFSEESEKVALDPAGRAVQLAKTLVEAEAGGCSVDMYRFNPDDPAAGWREWLVNYAHRPNVRRRLFEDFLDACLSVRPFACVDVSGLEWYEIDTVEELADAEDVFRRAGL